MKLQQDNYGFTIVQTLGELTQAKADGHVNVKVQCICGRGFVTSVSAAPLILSLEQCICPALPQTKVVRLKAEGAMFIHEEENFEL